MDEQALARVGLGTVLTPASAEQARGFGPGREGGAADWPGTNVRACSAMKSRERRK